MIQPEATVRRFDVFAEYTRLERLKEGLAADEAKGHGIWLAKVVAARKYGRIASGSARKATRPPGEAADRPAAKFRSLAGVQQTDGLFDKEIVARMGTEFYNQVFAPAIAKAFREGKTYREIRDEIRKNWRP